ncbi:MAG: hypothetical protein QXN56_06845 [Candidatus Hadarchaeum sp.]
MTIYRQTQQFWHGKSLYAGGNPYLPSTYILMAYQAPLKPHSAWWAWRVIGIVLSITTGLILYWGLLPRIGPTNSLLAVCNVMLLSGMSPWSGNPGNISGIGCVLAYALLSLGYPRLGGVILGAAAGLKYSLGLPFIFLAFVARYWRFASTAMGTFLMLNVVALFYLAIHGTPPSMVANSLFSGVIYVGGYNESGFREWFSADDPFRFQLMNMVPLLHSFGIPERPAQLLCLVILSLAVILSTFLAWKGKPHFLLSAAVFAPFFLLCTCHRFYDSALLAFSILLSWSATDGRNRICRWLIVVMSLAFILYISNILQVRLLLGSGFLESAVWNYLISPHHWYALGILCLSVMCLAIKYHRRMPGTTDSRSDTELP